MAVLLGAAAVWTAATGIVPFRGIRTRIGVDVRTAALALSVGSAVGVASAALFEIPAVAIAAGGLGAAIPVVRSQSRARSEVAAIRQRWPDVLFRIRGSLSAGTTLADATIEAFSAVGDPFEAIGERLRHEVLVGRGFGAGVASARSDFADATSDRVLVTLERASATGGQRVGEVLAALAMSVGDELRLFAAHDAAMAEQRLTINVALAAPWVLLILAIATNPQAQTAFSTAEGALVIGAGFVATSAGWLLAMRTAKLAETPRVFT